MRLQRLIRARVILNDRRVVEAARHTVKPVFAGAVLLLTTPDLAGNIGGDTSIRLGCGLFGCGTTSQKKREYKSKFHGPNVGLISSSRKSPLMGGQNSDSSMRRGAAK